MERPSPIFVGSMFVWWSLDMFPEREKQMDATEKNRQEERPACGCSSYNLCFSEEEQMKDRLYKLLSLSLLQAPSLWPSTCHWLNSTKYTSDPATTCNGQLQKRRHKTHDSDGFLRRNWFISLNMKLDVKNLNDSIKMKQFSQTTKLKISKLL